MVRLNDAEAPVQAGALDLLAHRGFPAMRVNSGAIQTIRGHWLQLAPEGTADIVGLIPRSGRFLAVECKRPGKKARRKRSQVEYLAAVRQHGGVGLFIADLDVLDRVLQALKTDPYATFDEAGEQQS